MDYLLPPARKYVLITLYFLCLSFALLAPIGSNEYIGHAFTGDYKNHTAIIVHAKQALDEGQFPLRVSPYEHEGLRYPIFQFYAPLFYTISGGIYKWITPDNPYLALKLTLLMGLVIGGLAAYGCAQKITQSTAISILGASAYLCMPYTLITLHNRAAVPECFARNLIPLCLLFIISLFQNKNTLRPLLLLSLAISALCLTHSITFFYSAGLMAVGCLIYCAQLRTFKPFILLTISYILSLLSCLWFIAPMWFVEPLLYIHNVLANPYITRAWTPLSALLSFTTVMPTTFPGPSFFNASEGATHPPVYASIGLVSSISVIVAMRYLYLGGLPTAYKKNLVTVLVLFGVALLLLWMPFDIYSYLPTLFQMAQYSYRLLSGPAWIGFLLFVIIMGHYYRNENMPLSTTLLFITLIILSASPWMKQQDNYYTVDKVIAKPHLGYSIGAYLLRWDAVTSYELKDAQAGHLNENCTLIGPTLHCDIHPEKKSTTFKIPMLYYPGLLDVRIDGKEVAYLPSFSLKGDLLTFVELNDSSRHIEAKFVGYTWANWVSALTLILISVLLLLPHSKQKGK